MTAKMNEKYSKVHGSALSGNLELPKGFLNWISCHKCGCKLFNVYYDEDHLLTVQCSKCGEVELRE